MRANGADNPKAAVRELLVHHLGRVEYEDGLKLQKLVGDARLRDLVPDTLLLLEHPPVITLGRAGKRANILASAEQLRSLDLEIFDTSRGGDVTYHGPGQIVGYPIFRLSPDRQDVRRYVRDLEESVIRALARFGIVGNRIAPWPGVWVGEEPDRAAKVAAIGVHLSRWQTSHGFALNVSTDLSYFELIVPCGIPHRGATSMERELGHALDLSEVERELSASFAEVFGAHLRVAAPPARTISVAILREDRDRVLILLLHRRPERGGFWQIVTGRVEPNESAAEAARRELFEETGFQIAVEDLGYRHSFAVGEEVPPRLAEETAFVARVDRQQLVRIDPLEHDRYEWVSVESALERLPFEGLRKAVLRSVVPPHPNPLPRGETGSTPP